MMEAILLGAGLSKRMGRQKLLLPFGGKTVIETVIDNLRDAGVERICAVLSREVAAALPRLPSGVETRVNEAPERGQSSSLAIGLEMIGEGRGFCIMLADLPLVTPDAITALARRFDGLPPEKNAARAVPRRRLRPPDVLPRRLARTLPHRAGRHGRTQNRIALRIRNRTRRRPRLPFQRHGHAGRLR